MSLNHTLEKGYRYAPVWLQNLGLSLYGYAYKRERLGGRFGDHVRAFQSRDHADPIEMRDYLRGALRQTLLSAYRDVPAYRNAWSALQLTERELSNFDELALSRLPITTKEEVRSRTEDYLSPTVAAREQVCRYQTSGSTGTPLTCSYTVDAHRAFLAAREVRSFRWAGTTLLGSRSMLGGRSILPRSNAGPPYHRYNLAEKQVYLSAYHIGPDTAEYYLEALNRHRPDVLTGYAHAHYSLAALLRGRGLRLEYEPKALVLSSEKTTDEMREVMQDVFRAPVFEEYGAIENVALITQCERGGMHANQDFGIVEIVDEHGQPCPPGQAGRLVSTALLNPAQPLVRYETGDWAVWSSRACACGREHLPLVQEIVGRLQDAIVTPDGRRMVGFYRVFNGLPIREGQVIQYSLRDLEVRIVADSGFNEDHVRTLEKRIRDERMGDVRVRVRRVETIERTERGKFRMIISHVDPDAISAATPAEAEGVRR